MSYNLNLLGALELRDSQGVPVNSVLQQPRRLALLVYLAIAERDAMVKRDTLCGIFWPDMPQENARRALSQAIHFLRRSLGAEAIVTRGTEDVGLNPEIVSCDATSFLSALKAHDARAAVAAYGGDLMPGFFASGSQEFETWLGVTRDSMRRSAAEALWTIAEEGKHQGETVSAATWARRAAELASDNEAATRRLMEFLDSIDDRAGALEAYDALDRRLQAEFESAPSPKTRELAERIRGARTAAVLANSEVAEADAARAPISKLPWQDLRKRSRTLAGTVILMAGFLSLWGLSRRADRAPMVRTDASVLVEQPKVFNPELRDLSAAVASDVAAALVSVPDLDVISGTTQSAAGSDVHFVLQPNFSVRDGGVYVVASLIDEGTHTIVQSASFRAKADDQASLTALAANMSEFARLAMGRHVRETRLEQSKGEDADVIMQSTVARMRVDSLLNKRLAPLAMATLEHADSTLDAALKQHASAALFVERAEIARSKMWTYLAPPLVNVKAFAAAAEQGIQYADHAIDVDRNNAAAYELHGLFAFAQWSSPGIDSREAVGRRSEAERFLQKAVALNPHAARSWSALSTILLSEGDYSSAYVAANKAFTTDTYLETIDATTATLFTASLETGDSASAERWCSDMSRRSGQTWLGAYCKLQIIAWTDRPSAEATRAAQQLVDEASADRESAMFMPMVNNILAVVYAKHGDAAKAESLLAENRSGALEQECQPFRAWALGVLGKTAEARSTLTSFINANPAVRAGIARSTRFASFES